MSHHDPKVCVKRIIVEYTFNGERFQLTFDDPMKIQSIVLGGTELKRINQELQDTSKRTHNCEFDPATPLQDQQLTHMPFGTSTRIGKDPSDEGAPLWWHTDAGTWFHPRL